jgi:hypothetical protein
MSTLHRHKYHIIQISDKKYDYIHLSERVCRENECRFGGCPCMKCYSDRMDDELRTLFQGHKLFEQSAFDKPSTVTLDYLKLLHPPQPRKWNVVGWDIT